jgi:NAD(P)-dependent dehydrogenase (short-subunit alcohol dehydrogenase family)
VRTALVTGANRGIGLEVCRQLAQLGLRVVLTAREAGVAAAAVHSLLEEGLAEQPPIGGRRAGLDVLPAALDVAREDAAGACADALAHLGIHIDVLVNNAGIYPSGGVLDTSPRTLRATIDTNFLGALWTCQAFVPGMLRAGYGRVVNVSSGYGSFAEGLEGPAAYSLSKAALNALTVKLAAELAAEVAAGIAAEVALTGADIKVNAACPGWVRTEMGGPDAERSVAEGADTIVWLATLQLDGPSGGFFRDRARIPW